MFSASVAATLYVLCAALNACFASSLSVTTAAPRAIPPPRTSALRRLLLFLNAGRAGAGSILVAKVRRCDCRHVRHVHGAGRGTAAVRRARHVPWRRLVETREDIMWLCAHGIVKANVYSSALNSKKKEMTAAGGW
jgi:hypothetical protein